MMINTTALHFLSRCNEMWDVLTLLTLCFHFVVFSKRVGCICFAMPFFALEARGRVLWMNPLRRSVFIKRLSPSALSCNNIHVVLCVVIINTVVLIHEGFVQM
jgi:hypothetical protein